MMKIYTRRSLYACVWLRITSENSDEQGHRKIDRYYFQCSLFFGTGSSNFFCASSIVRSPPPAPSCSVAISSSPEILPHRCTLNSSTASFSSNAHNHPRRAAEFAQTANNWRQREKTIAAVIALCVYF